RSESAGTDTDRCDGNVLHSSADPCRIAKPPAVCTYQAAGRPLPAQPRPGVPLVMTKEAYLTTRVAAGFRLDLVNQSTVGRKNGPCPPSNRDARRRRGRLFAPDGRG